MTANTKRVWCDFYKCEVISGQRRLPDISMDQVLSGLLVRFETEGQDTVNEVGGRAYELREIQATDFGFSGVVGKYRAADLPHAAIPGGVEREIDLAENEQLLEKVYFSYYSDYELMILQRKRNVVGSRKFSQYLTRGGYTVALNPVIEAADLRRLMSNDVHVRVAELSIARPTNPDLYRDMDHDFNNSIIQSLNSTNAAKINVTLRGDGHSRDPERRYLEPVFKRALLEMKDRLDVEKAQLELEDDSGVVHPLDLVTDRLVYDELVEYEGRYPRSDQVFQILQNARNEKNTEIESYFGALADARLE